MASAAAPEQGQLVQVRSRPWVVNEVKPSTLPAPVLALPVVQPQHLLTLSSVEDDGLGEEVQVVWEIEPGAKLIERVALPEPTGFDAPAQLDAFLDAVRWGAASTADHKNIQAPFRSGIEIEDYQLDPVVRAIQMPRANLLIADDDGIWWFDRAGECHASVQIESADGCCPFWIEGKQRRTGRTVEEAMRYLLEELGLND